MVDQVFMMPRAVAVHTRTQSDCWAADGAGPLACKPGCCGLRPSIAVVRTRPPEAPRVLPGAREQLPYFPRPVVQRVVLQHVGHQVVHHADPVTASDRTLYRELPGPVSDRLPPPADRRARCVWASYGRTS